MDDDTKRRRIIKQLILKTSDCFFTITAGSVLVALFEGKEAAYQISFFAYVYALGLYCKGSQIDD